jgi:hypothetical protein
VGGLTNTVPYTVTATRELEKSGSVVEQEQDHLSISFFSTLSLTTGEIGQKAKAR